MITRENIQQATEFILSTLVKQDFSSRTIHSYRSIYQKLNDYIQKKSFAEIDETVFVNFLQAECQICVPSVYTKGHSKPIGGVIKPITVLDYYLLTGKIDHRARMRTPPVECPDGFIESYTSFIEFLQFKELSSSSIRNNCVITEKMIQYLVQDGITSVDMISSKDVLSILPKFQTYLAHSFSFVLYAIRNYLTFLFKNGYLEEELSWVLPRLRVSKNTKIPHSWSKEELKAILNAVDRANPTGKRDYAILLLIIQTGLRAADIRKLNLNDIDWKLHKIHIVTEKNANIVDLPLLDSTGWAIIDYLRNGRPKTICENVFIRHIPPYESLGSAAGLDSALYRYITKAGIAIKEGERHGLHTLRNSFAKNMLDCGTPLPVISQALGHRNVNTTAIYLKIDINGLRQCALSYDDCEVEL